MPIIAVNRFYSPDYSATSQLLTDLAEHLTQNGQKVTVITSRMLYNDKSVKLDAREEINGVEIVRIWTSNFGRLALPGRTIDYLTFYLTASWALMRRVSEGDTIIAKTDPPLISVVAAIVASFKGARLIHWCQDLFPEIAGALGMNWANGPLGQLLRRWRNWSLRQAETNVVLCDAMQARLVAEGIDPAQIRVIHNWCDHSIRPLPMPSDNSGLIINYSGNLGRAHCPEAIARLIQSCAEDSGLLHLRWRFTGGGVGLERLKAALPESSLARVEFHPYQPLDRLSESLAACHLHLVSLDPACEGLIMPSKLYGILAAGRPVLFLGDADGAVAKLVGRHDLGIVLPIDAGDEWTNAICAHALNEDCRQRQGREAKSLSLELFQANRALSGWTSVVAGNEISVLVQRSTLDAA